MEEGVTGVSEMVFVLLAADHPPRLTCLIWGRDKRTSMSWSLVYGTDHSLST